MTPTQRYEQLKGQADNLRQKISRAEGALEQHMARLKDEHGCKTIEDAKRKLKRLDREASEATAAFEAAADEFEEKWEEVLGE